MRKPRGITLIEVIFCILILVIFAFMGVTTLRLVNSLFRESALLRTQREVQTVQYLLLNEVRNAHDIISIAPDKLVLSTINRQGDDFDTLTNPNLFTSFGQMVYEYQTVAGHSYLVKTYTPPVGAPIQKRFLQDILGPPTSVPLFESLSGTTYPFKFVRINFNVTGGNFNQAPRTFSVDVSRRNHI